MAPDGSYDVAVIGGGVNGCGIARDAQGRGLDVILAEMGDLASATSSASTKLIHGGLRYLEHYEFRLVREALEEREVLLKSAPHIIWPLRFVLPYHRGLRPWPVIRLGLFFYDHLGGRKLLPGARTVDLRKDRVGDCLKPSFKSGFEYSDCWVEDSRLVVLNALDASERGAAIHTRTRCVSAHRENGLWQIVLENVRSGDRFKVAAKALVNAAGPWVSDFLGSVVGRNAPAKVRLVKGSHIVVDRVSDHDAAYIFQNADGRICFAIPYETDYTLIGTTDEEYDGDPGKVEISDSEIDYLLRSVSEYVEMPVQREAIRWTYSGVRPLFDDGASKAQEATRDYHLELESSDGQPPLLSIFGGKITTFRRLAESVMDRLAPFFPDMAGQWTADATLPGGDLPPTAFDGWAAGIGRRYPFLERSVIRRLCHAYGTRVDQVLGDAQRLEDLGADFGAGLSEREVDYLRDIEWAETPEDVLWRRSKLGLHLSREGAGAVAEYMGAGKSAPQQMASGG